MFRPDGYADKTDDKLRIQMQQIAQELTHRLTTATQRSKVELPRGHIRPLHEPTRRWPYVMPETRRTLACFVQLCDVNRWTLNVFEIGLTAGTMWVWQCCIPVIAVRDVHDFERRVGCAREHEPPSVAPRPRRLACPRPAGDDAGERLQGLSR